MAGALPTADHGHRYAELIPNATFAEVQDCGHAMYFERPEEFARITADFLTGTSEEMFQWISPNYEYRYVNIWPRPLQQPHPPIYIPGAGSTETMQFVAEHGYTYMSVYAPSPPRSCRPYGPWAWRTTSPPPRDHPTVERSPRPARPLHRGLAGGRSSSVPTKWLK